MAGKIFRPQKNVSTRAGPLIWTVRLMTMAALALALPAQGALADTMTLPGVTAQASATAGYNTITVNVPPAKLPISAVNSTGIESDGSSSSSAAVTGGSDPTVSASAAATANGDTRYGATGFASLNFSFEVVGPSTASQVPVSLQGTNSQSLNVTSGNNQTILNAFVAVTGGGSGVSISGGSYSTTLELDVGTTYGVFMVANAFTVAADTTLLGIAYVDPTFTVSPNFSSNYSIVYSPGLLSTAVPEPNTLLLVVVALAGLFLFRGWRPGLQLLRGGRGSRLRRM